MILEAKDFTIGSYAWKSIISARDVICKGMVWRIGNEQSVRIREDKWLPVQTNRSTLSPLHDVQPETKVSTLINQDLGIWNSSQIEQMFLPYKSTMNLGIPLSPRLPFDRIIWGLTLNGRYSTSSAYKTSVSCASSNNANSSNLEAQKLVWNGIWQLRTPNKIKHFVWHACNNALPTMKNPYHHYISTSEICEICRIDAEDPLHALWFCKELDCVRVSLLGT